MLGALFVEGGVRQFLAARDVAPLAAPVTDPVRATVGPPLADASDITLVRANAAAQLLGGGLLVVGRAPRLASALLAASLVPSTLAEHRFWEVDDLDERLEVRTRFMTNLALLGGLLLATMDTEGEPGLVWSGRHAVDHAGTEARHLREVAGLRAELAGARAGHVVDRAADQAELAARRAVPDAIDAGRALVGALAGSDED
jgi:uncharacterized membrane protein YphA (DoxX/SURF4 family)